MKKRAFTLIELLVVIAIIALLVGILLPALGKARASARQVKDATQVKSIGQAMVTWAGGNKDLYPKPSAMDKNGATILPDAASAPAKQFNKDITGNFLSLLIWNGSITTDLCYNPAESSGAVQIYQNYQSSRPANANDVANALWDPNFAGTPVDVTTGLSKVSNVGNNSYAQGMFVGTRGARWSNTFKSDEAVFGDRGPCYTTDGSDQAKYNASGWKYNPTGTLVSAGGPGVDSLTLLIHGGRQTWEGNIGYNDNHVNFETKGDPDSVTYRRTGTTAPLTIADNLFVDESDDAAGFGQTPPFQRNTNQYLRPIAAVAGGTESAATVSKSSNSSILVWVD